MYIDYYNKEQQNYFEYFIVEKRRYLVALGLTEYEILEKYKKDLREYSKNKDYYQNIIVALERAIVHIGG